MNILFMLGNGFDLNMGLKTRFRDVLTGYLKLNTDKEHIKKFKENINQDIELWSDFESQLGVYTEEFLPSTIDKYLDCRKDFSDYLVEYLKNEENKINYNELKGEIDTVITSSVFGFYNMVIEGMSLYNSIKNNSENNDEYNFITFNYTSVLENLLRVYNNKINTFDNLGIYDGINEILHIHGTTSTALIIGVNDDSQIKNNDLLNNKLFRQQIIKPEINERLKNILNERMRRAEELIDKSTVICMFGLSIGKTDNYWWNKIIEWLNSSENNHLIIFLNNENWNTKDPEVLIEIEEEIKPKFLKASNSQDESIENISRVHFGINTNFFKIKLL